MNSRLKLLRKTLKKTQHEFGILCGKSRDVISTYEIGRVIPDDTFIKFICMKFNVNEKWLRTGEGDMFTDNKDSIFKAFAEKYHLSDTEQELAKYCLSLSSEQRKEILNHVRQISKILSSNNNIEIISQRTKPDHKLTPEEKRRIVNEEIHQEEKATTSSASTGTNGM